MQSVLCRTCLLAAFFLLAACEPEATPLPAVAPPTPTPIAPTSTPAPVRYALSPEMAGFTPDTEAISAAAQVEQLEEEARPEDLGARYDLIAAYGDRPGWERSPITPRVALVVNSTVPPLDTPPVADVVRRSIDAQAVVDALAIPGAQAEAADSISLPELRAALANAGLPDGFDARVAYTTTPGIAQISERLAALGIGSAPAPMSDAEIVTAFDAGRLHLALVVWTTPEARASWTARAGADNVIDLYALPISYLAVEGLDLTFTPGGLPVIQPAS